VGEIRNKYKVLFRKSEAKSVVTNMETWSKEKVHLVRWRFWFSAWNKVNFDSVHNFVTVITH